VIYFYDFFRVMVISDLKVSLFISYKTFLWWICFETVITTVCIHSVVKRAWLRSFTELVSVDICFRVDIRVFDVASTRNFSLQFKSTLRNLPLQDEQYFLTFKTLKITFQILKIWKVFLKNLFLVKNYGNMCDIIEDPFDDFLCQTY
jgi:hypothetical protein